MPLSPLMQQYLETKKQYPEAILFYRIGDFYEMFFDDAKLASRELELTLTGKDCGLEERAPMCGVPFHAADVYVGRLVAKGYKVVICEQTEDPALAKGLVKREVIRTVTPGTVIDNTQIPDDKNNYLSAVCFTDASEASDENGGEAAGIAVGFADITTGEFSVTFFAGESAERQLMNELATFSPREILLNRPLPEGSPLRAFFRERLNASVSENGNEKRFDYVHDLALVTKQFGQSTLEAGTVPPPAVRAAGALLDYVLETQMTDISNISKLNYFEDGQYLGLDVSTRRNLELTESMRSKEKKGTLLWVLDRTRTAMGARLLRKWIEQPLLNANHIVKRQKAVEELAGSFMIREELSDLLRRVLDLERLMTKLVYGTANARDLRAIHATISVLPDVKKLLADFTSAELAGIAKEMDPLDDIRDLIGRSIVDEPPFSIREAGFIRPGYNAQVDELHEIVFNGKDYVERLAAEEREKTGIKNLKIAYNRVFGYYIEVTRSFLDLVPDRYIRKQTLTTGERYITEELKEKETVIVGASDRLSALEYELFVGIRERITAEIQRVQASAAMMAKLDVYLSLADVAVRNNYVCPEVEYGSVIEIKDGRHPVVEQFCEDGYFVPNDTLLDTNHNRLALITGPNMAGKSTYMRQVALITLMAQIGSFVPAREARIGIVDKIFTRVGASDDLASGQSTFMLEMNEVAAILKNATRRSLIVYDEIGRGTSTYDGMSIARAVAEYTVGKKLGAKTLFATHYHELNDLADELDGIVNYNIAAKKTGDSITFLRKIVKGSVDDSYGIEVAKLAGIPNEVIRRAKEVLKTLNEKGIVPREPEKKEENSNITFDDYRANDVRVKLLNTDVNILTPIEALNLLVELKRLAE